MSNLRIEQFSTEKLVMSTPKLGNIIKEGLITGLTVILIPFVILSGLVAKSVYSGLKKQSNQGYLYEMTCERLEKNFINCKLDQTDIKGIKSRVFSTAIKSATYSFVTTNVYTCSISLVKRDGTKINNLELFTNIEYSRDCPTTKAVVNQINRYILGDGNKPLTWQRDKRTGDSTKDWIKNPNLIRDTLTLFYVGGFIYFLIVINVLFHSVEQFCSFDTRSSLIIYRSKRLFFRSDQRFSFNNLEKTEFSSSVLNPVIISIKDLVKKKVLELNFSKKDDQTKVITFLEGATELKAEEIVTTDD